MATILNAVSGTGLTQTADGSGVIKLQSNGVTTNALAWVNFNGTSATPITPRANYNISSVTKNGTGDYTLNFTSALSDANYVTNLYAYSTGANNLLMARIGYAPSTASIRLGVYNTTPSLSDVEYINVAIFGN
jgi:hypothetical protein